MRERTNLKIEEGYKKEKMMDDGGSVGGKGGLKVGKRKEKRIERRRRMERGDGRQGWIKNGKRGENSGQKNGK